MSKSVSSRIEALERQSGPVPVIVANEGESTEQVIIRCVDLSQYQRHRMIVVHTGVPARCIQETDK